MPLLVLAASAGCHEDSTCGGNDVLGHPSDVKSVPGAREGYEVIKGCTVSPAQFAVRGLGSGTGHASVYELCTKVSRPGVVFECWVVNSACTTSGGMIGVSDWRAVDAVLDQVGHLLSDNSSPLEMAIRVYPPPCE